MTCETINDDKTIVGGTGALLAKRYRVVRQLGQGGMGSVWLVEDTQLDGKQFAVKMLPSILVNNRRAYAQLKKEALVAMQLVHPNIVQVRDFEENGGNPFLVMDYIDGQTLDDYLAAHTGTTGVPPVANAPAARSSRTGSLPVLYGLPESDVLRLLRPIAAALDYAHTKGVVHRDVKPGNVMIAKDGTPYILDFGIAREIQETMTRVTGKLSSGTLLYMSPEQLMGEEPQAAQDVYSFAAMAYECLKGKPPFCRGDIEYQIMNKQPEPLAGVSTMGSLPVGASVMTGLAKQPKDRPPTCTAVLERKVLSRVEHVERVDGNDVVGRRVPTPPQSEERRPVVVLHGLLAAAAFSLAAFCGWWWLSGRNETTETEVVKAGHKGIQLWENGPYWAETNIGAEKPEDYGYYFWWGDTVGYKRDGNAWAASDGSTPNFSFGESNVPTHGKTPRELQSEGWITEDGVLAPEYDAAHVQWGGGWRMPTIEELKDLNSKCDWKWKTANGVEGYAVHGRGAYASVSIFLPAAGRGNGTSLNSSGSNGFYWSSVPYSDYDYAYVLYFDSGYHYTGFNYRFSGRSVRPVQGFTK